MSNGLIVIDTKEGVSMYRLLALKASLRLELMGMKHSRVNVYTLVKREFGLKGNKQKVYDQFVALVEQKKKEYERK
jgi:hypothetical protein